MTANRVFGCITRYGFSRNLSMSDVFRTIVGQGILLSALK